MCVTNAARRSPPRTTWTNTKTMQHALDEGQEPAPAPVFLVRFDVSPESGTLEGRHDLLPEEVDRSRLARSRDVDDDVRRAKA